MNYYNEWDEYAAEWLRNLIDAGHIAPGVVDTRSIKDVHPDDLRPYTQCHFFAGIGVWSLALRRAGWADDRRIWSASCPCQPFSSAGRGAGTADERHLWPHLFHLITQCNPELIVGEQVASKDAEPWLDLVQADMEGMGHAFGAVAFPAASVGAPHIRDRTYWVAHADGLARGQGRAIDGGRHQGSDAWSRPGPGDGVVFDRLADSGGQGLEGSDHRAMGDELAAVERGGAAGGMANHHDRRLERQQDLRLRGSDVHDADGRSPLRGAWSDADWIFCRDGKWRPVEPGTFPLAHGAPGRVGRLRAYGNAIVAPQAQTWIETVMGCLP